MTCEDVELSLLEGPRSAELEQHLATCPSCRAFAADVALVERQAALPEPTKTELDSLEGLSQSTWAEWNRRELQQRWRGHAVAAAIGALVASLAFWVARPTRDVVIERVIEPVAALEASNDEPNLFAEEVFFDVTWPDLADGEDP